MLVICVTTDKTYSGVPRFLQPMYIGFTLLAIGVAYGSNGGYALNPVRKLLNAAEAIRKEKKTRPRHVSCRLLCTLQRKYLFDSRMFHALAGS